MAEEDPLSYLAGPSKASPLFDDERGAADSSSVGSDLGGLRQVSASKFGGKSSVAKEKAKAQAAQTASSSSVAPKDINAPASQYERGLGFSTVPELSSDSSNKLHKDTVQEVDILATLAASEDQFNELESSIFDTLGVPGNSSKSKDKADLFGKKTTAGVPRIGNKFGSGDESLVGLSTTKFLSKEEELDYDVFGESQTKQNIKKQTEKLKAQGTADESELDDIQHLKLSEEAENAPTARAVNIEIDSQLQKPAAEITDFDDVDAYIAKMAGGSSTSGDSGDGGLFD